MATSAGSRMDCSMALPVIKICCPALAEATASNGNDKVVSSGLLVTPMYAADCSSGKLTVVRLACELSTSELPSIEVILGNEKTSNAASLKLKGPTTCVIPGIVMLVKPLPYTDRPCTCTSEAKRSVARSRGLSVMAS